MRVLLTAISDVRNCERLQGCASLMALDESVGGYKHNFNPFCVLSYREVIVKKKLQHLGLLDSTPVNYEVIQQLA